MRRRPRRRKKSCFTVAGLTVLATVLLGAVLFFVWQEGEGFFGALPAQEEEVPYQQVSLEEGSLEDKYYYGQIPEEDQKAYQEVLEGLREHQEEIYVHCEKAERANELFALVLKDFPEIFWCDGRVTATAYSGGEPYTVLEPRYLCGVEEQKNGSRRSGKKPGSGLPGRRGRPGILRRSNTCMRPL